MSENSVVKLGAASYVSNKFWPGLLSAQIKEKRRQKRRKAEDRVNGKSGRRGTDRRQLAACLSWNYIVNSKQKRRAYNEKSTENAESWNAV